MKNENLSNKLKVAISILEKKQTSEFNELRTECEIVLNEFKPLNMMGQVSKFITSEPNIKNNLFNAVLSLGLGYVSKKFIPKKINSLLNRITQFASNLKMA
ncbi:hypothetical protein [Flavobacterium terrae]|uniref:Uncharacterized protein n=1 Tax=Flavobacterium terrae TaxID=415425 RepID=A0A1M6GN74_9FLAO|nr:hypothetical protein [Flavobacterium terrae]SHJ11381.1 hypothetical protein SAMN05444363_2699 [Flavobacterium terrae]